MHSYFKNVRKEWASLVSTPPYAQFQDALAFTRSLGDLHLHLYGEQRERCPRGVIDLLQWDLSNE